MNSVVLIGRLTRDPELRYAPESQLAVANFSIAVDRPFSKDKEKTADFIRIVCFGKQAEFCERYFFKGKQIAIQGRLQERSYQDKNGETKYISEVVAERVEFVGSKDDGGRGGEDRSYDGGDRARQGSSPAPKADAGIPEGFQALDDDDDIPF